MEKQVRKATAAAVWRLLIILLIPPRVIQAQSNRAPALNAPASNNLRYPFPKGEATTQRFTSTPATGADDNPLTYRFVFTTLDASTTGDTTDTTRVAPSEALSQGAQSGNDGTAAKPESRTPSETPPTQAARPGAGPSAKPPSEEQEP